MRHAAPGMMTRFVAAETPLDPGTAIRFPALESVESATRLMAPLTPPESPTLIISFIAPLKAGLGAANPVMLRVVVLFVMSRTTFDAAQPDGL